VVFLRELLSEHPCSGDGRFAVTVQYRRPYDRL